jgi:hypothetical protein
MHLAEGDYTSGLIVAGHLVGAVHMQVVGNCANPQAVNVNPGGDGTAFTVEYGGKLRVACVQVSGSDATGFLSRTTGVLQVNFRPDDAVVFGDMPGGNGVVAADGGIVNISGVIVISGNAAIHWAASSMSQISVEDGTTYSISDAYAINYFLHAILNSVVSLGENVTFGGPDPNGNKYKVTSGSRLNLNENVLPGTIPGTVDDKGQVF